MKIAQPQHLMLMWPYTPTIDRRRWFKKDQRPYTRYKVREGSEEENRRQCLCEYIMELMDRFQTRYQLPHNSWELRKHLKRLGEYYKVPHLFVVDCHKSFTWIGVAFEAIVFGPNGEYIPRTKGACILIENSTHIYAGTPVRRIKTFTPTEKDMVRAYELACRKLKMRI